MNIKTIDYHTAELARLEENRLRRIEAQMEDAALSINADANLSDFHREAIRMLKRGIELTGQEVPFDCVHFIVDAFTGDPVDAKMIHTRNGWCWIVSDELESKFGRKFLPMGEKSRVHKSLGVRQEMREVEVERRTKSWSAGSFTVRYHTFAKEAA